MIAFYPRFRTNGAFVRHSRNNPCPICGKTDWCRTFEDGGTECMRKPSSVPTKNGGWMHWPDGAEPNDWRDQVFKASPQPPTISFKAKAPRLDEIYRRLVALLSLSDEHREALRGRRFTDAEIDGLEYRTLPQTGRAPIAAALVDEFGTTILGTVPGLYIRRNRNDDHFAMLAGKAGLLIPVRNLKREIVGFQIRMDEPGDGGKYAWFSSKDKELGCGSGAPIHVAYPLDGAGGWDMSVGATVTEGPIKADISAQRLGAPVFSVSGVGNYAGVVEILEALKTSEALIAYDMDAMSNEQVKRHRDGLAADLIAASITPFLVTWDPAYKGLDDALSAGVDPIVEPYPLVRKSGQLEEIDPIARQLRAVLSPDEARARMGRSIQMLIQRPEPSLTVFRSVTGSGKTHAVAKALADLHRSQQWPKVPSKTKKGGLDREVRVAFVTATKELAHEFAATVNGLAAAPLAMVMEGRDADPNHTWGCHRPELIHLAGQNRHNPMVDVCMDCKSEYEAIYGRHWLCNYLNSKKLSESRRLIVAPYASLFNASSELRNFDIIIVDETFLPTITESVSLTTDHVDQWLTEMDRLSGDGQFGKFGLDSAFRRLANLIKIVIASARDVGHDWIPARDQLLAHCPDIQTVLWEIADLTTDDDKEHRRYAFERPELDLHRQRVPLRLLIDLLPALISEAGRCDGGDSRLWLTPDGLRLFLVRDHLVEILRERCVINLDATPSPLLRFLFPAMKEAAFDAKPHMHITQVVDALMTRSQLGGEVNPLRDRVSVALETITINATAPVVFTFKGLDANVAGDGPRLRVSNPSATYGHFDSETRGLNRFQDADMIAVVGRYSSPISELRMQAQGCRFAEKPPRVRIDARDQDGRPLRLRPYLWIDAEGKSYGRWSIADQDPDVENLVRWSESSIVLQAIGRGRAVLRSEDAPLRVYLFTANPIADLPIDELTKLEHLGAPPPRRETPPGFYDERDERNGETATSNRQIVAQAIARFREQKVAITRSGISRETGISLKTLKANATLRAMVDQAMTATNDITVPSTPWTDLTTNRDDQGVLPPVIESDEVGDQGVTPQVIDLSPVQQAIQRADHASKQGRREAKEELASRLAEIAELRRGGPLPPQSMRRDISHSLPNEGEIA